MNEYQESSAQKEREPGLALLDEALREVILSSPEPLNKLADQLESELSTLDAEEAKKLIRDVIGAMRAAAAVVEQGTN